MEEPKPHDLPEEPELTPEEVCRDFPTFVRTLWERTFRISGLELSPKKVVLWVLSILVVSAGLKALLFQENFFFALIEPLVVFAAGLILLLPVYFLTRSRHQKAAGGYAAVLFVIAVTILALVLLLLVGLLIHAVITAIIP